MCVHGLDQQAVCEHGLGQQAGKPIAVQPILGSANCTWLHQRGD